MPTIGDGRLGHRKSTLGKTILGFGNLGEDIESGCSGLRRDVRTGCLHDAY